MTESSAPPRAVPQPARQQEQEVLDDDFFMYKAKIQMCTKEYAHEFASCPFLHPNEPARRRDPRLFNYQSVLCCDKKREKVCRRGINCPYSHSVFEYFLHPDRYRTRMCELGEGCNRKLCFFAHSEAQLRPRNSSKASRCATAQQRKPEPLPAVPQVTLLKQQSDGGSSGGGSPSSGFGSLSRCSSSQLYTSQADEAAEQQALQQAQQQQLRQQLWQQQQLGPVLPQDGALQAQQLLQQQQQPLHAVLGQDLAALLQCQQQLAGLDVAATVAVQAPGLQLSSAAAPSSQPLLWAGKPLAPDLIAAAGAPSAAAAVHPQTLLRSLSSGQLVLLGARLGTSTSAPVPAAGPHLQSLQQQLSHTPMQLAPCSAEPWTPASEALSVVGRGAPLPVAAGAASGGAPSLSSPGVCCGAAVTPLQLQLGLLPGGAGFPGHAGGLQALHQQPASLAPACLPPQHSLPLASGLPQSQPLLLQQCSTAALASSTSLTGMQTAGWGQHAPPALMLAASGSGQLAAAPGALTAQALSSDLALLGPGVPLPHAWQGGE